jgi:hypothetical protein
MEKGEIIKQLSQLSSSFDKAQHDFLGDHPNIGASNDARATVFSHCYLVLDSACVCLVVRFYVASESDWWGKMVQEGKMSRQFNAENLSTFLDGFSYFIMSACLGLLAGVVESAFRIFHDVVFPSLDVPKNFDKVCENLFSTCGLGLEGYLRLMKLLRLLRNALAHNNGLHIYDDDHAGWNGVCIDFKRGQKVKLGESGWKVLFRIAYGILGMLEKVVKSNKIIEKPMIKDPSYADSSNIKVL